VLASVLALSVVALDMVMPTLKDPSPPVRTPKQLAWAATKCEAALQSLPDDAWARAKVLAEACEHVYSEPSCWHAWGDPWVETADRFAAIVAACQAGYCAADPRRASCPLDRGPMEHVDRMRAWKRIHAAILRQELGPAATRLAALVEVVIPPPRAGDFSVDSGDDLLLKVTRQGVALFSRASQAPEQPVFVVRATGAAFDPDALETALKGEVARRWPDPSQRPVVSQRLGLVADADTSYLAISLAQTIAKGSFSRVFVFMQPR